MKETTRGQHVVCNWFNGEAFELIILEDSSSLISVHSEDQFKVHVDGRPHIEPVGFPAEDVFIQKERISGRNIDWSKAER